MILLPAMTSDSSCFSLPTSLSPTLVMGTTLRVSDRSSASLASSFMPSSEILTCKPPTLKVPQMLELDQFAQPRVAHPAVPSKVERVELLESADVLEHSIGDVATGKNQSPQLREAGQVFEAGHVFQAGHVAQTQRTELLQPSQVLEAVRAPGLGQVQRLELLELGQFLEAGRRQAEAGLKQFQLLEAGQFLQAEFADRGEAEIERLQLPEPGQIFHAGVADPGLRQIEHLQLPETVERFNPSSVTEQLLMSRACSSWKRANSLRPASVRRLCRK